MIELIPVIGKNKEVLGIIKCDKDLVSTVQTFLDKRIAITMAQTFSLSKRYELLINTYNHALISAVYRFLSSQYKVIRLWFGVVIFYKTPYDRMQIVKQLQHISALMDYNQGASFEEFYKINLEEDDDEF